jgi:hypothetical protein
MLRERESGGGNDGGKPLWRSKIVSGKGIKKA